MGKTIKAKNGWEVRFNEDPVKKGKKASAAAFEATAKALDKAFDEAFSVSSWSWPNAPQSRDIILTGELRDSKAFKLTKGYGKSGMKADWTWKAPYASAIYLGYRTEVRTYPGRPWADATLGIKPQSGVAIFEWDKEFRKNLDAGMNSK